MRIIPTLSINKWCDSNEKDFIRFCEEEYYYQILGVAVSIETPVVLICGPSGSAKTSSSFRLKDVLNKLGKPAEVISMDNYFLSKDDPRSKLGEDGKLDYESPDRVDVQLLSEHLSRILDGKEIEVPSFNFKLQQREKGRSLKRSKGGIVIVEGIHALNPAVTGTVFKESTGIYVSVRTRLQSDDGILLHPSKIRLMRRFVRDKLFRGRAFSETYAFFKDVERGEALYIAPYKENASFDIDTFLPYEPCIYKNLIIDELSELAKGCRQSEIRELLDIVTGLNTTQRINVPKDSLVREFIGLDN